MLILKHKRKVDMASIGSTLVLEISKHVNEIRVATTYEKVSSTVEKTQKALSDILATGAGSREFSKAIIAQFSLLDVLKEKNWISEKELRFIGERAIEFGKSHKPSDDPEEISEFEGFLKAQAKEIGLD